MWQIILGSSITMIGFIFIIGLIYYIFSFKNIRNQKQHFKNIHKELAVNNQVILANGIYGEIKKIQDETVDVEIKSGAVMTVSRYAISEVIR